AAATGRPAEGAAGRELRLVALGASTGGPNAIQAILTGLGSGFPVPIVVAQHMPPGFTRTFAERLDRVSGLSVREAVDGDRLAGGRVLIAPGGLNLRVVRDGGGLAVRTEPRAPGQSYVPSVDALFESAAAAVGPALVAVLLTGMGNDGRRGMLAVKAAGGQTLAESEETAIVFGMPGEAIAAGAVDEILPLPALAPELLRRAGAKIA
ncbi:MAG TPA: CheB methylesterase domain-containing protein, partial [Thermodesulfobacteriota bacterium]|nr:CheB methylesterase domain-containing protein [Thermodesulfobacteriota bacterium]